MSAEEKLARIHVKVERANKHLFDLQALCAAFIQSDPYKVVAKKDPNTGKVVGIRVESVQPVPIGIPLSANFLDSRKKTPARLAPAGVLNHHALRSRWRRMRWEPA